MSLIPIDRTSSNYLSDASSFNTTLTTSLWQVSAWLYDTAGTHRVLYTDATPCIAITSSAGHIQVYDGTNYSDSTLTSQSGWTHVLLTHASDGTVSCVQDGTSINTSPNVISSSVVFGNSNVTLMRGGCTMFDLRIKDGTCDSTAWAYYRDNVINGGGDIFLPQG